jgi:hypothetical protein
MFKCIVCNTEINHGNYCYRCSPEKLRREKKEIYNLSLERQIKIKQLELRKLKFRKKGL